MPTSEKFRVGENPNRVIRELFRLGHFHNPAHATGVTKEELATLNLTDGPVRTATARHNHDHGAE